MRLGAVVIIMKAAGCVCEVIDKTRTTAFSAAAAGGAAINMAVQMRHQQQQAAQNQSGTMTRLGTFHPAAHVHLFSVDRPPPR